MRRSTGHRDQAIILTLLDTGLRASELSALKVGNMDDSNHSHFPTDLRPNEWALLAAFFPPINVGAAASGRWGKL